MKTGNKCAVCTCEDKDAINEKLIMGKSVRNVAEDYGISKSAVDRHRQNHLPRDMVKSKQLQEVDAADKLVERIEGLYNKAFELIDKAEERQSFTGATSAIREARSALELLAKITGELKSGTHLTLVYSPQWVSLRSVLVNALEPFPDARETVVRALEVHEQDEIIDG